MLPLKRPLLKLLPERVDEPLPKERLGVPTFDDLVPVERNVPKDELLLPPFVVLRFTLPPEKERDGVKRLEPRLALRSVSPTVRLVLLSRTLSPSRRCPLPC